MRLVTGAEMREIEDRALADYGLSGETLMNNAALAVVRHLRERLGPGPARAAVFCGKGNNAGDGWTIARLLTDEGWAVKVFHPGLELELPPAAELNRRLALERRVPEGSWREGLGELQDFDVVIDALLGTGIRGTIEGDLKEAIDGINRSGLPVLAVDIPSGVSGDTGQTAGAAVRAKWTVTFGCMKTGLAVYPGRELAGEIVLDPIGLPSKLLQGGRCFSIERQLVAELLPRRPRDTHKGRNGHLLVIGGSEGLTGAPVLSGLAGLRSGAGLVTIGRRVGLEIPEKPPELMTVTWRGIDWENYQAIVFGPGLSREEDGLSMLEKVLAKTALPRLIDADGLNLLAAIGAFNLKRWAKGSLVLTPHPGEMARLCGITVQQVQANRIELAREKAEEWEAVLVLKGAATLVAAPGGRLWVNTTGNPGLSTAGTGDVLAGVIGSLMAQGLKPEDAAVAGTYLHGLAGDIAAEELGEVGLIAGDLLPRLPRAIRSVKQE